VCQSAPKYTICRLKTKKIFLGRGLTPLPRPHPLGACGASSRAFGTHSSNRACPLLGWFRRLWYDMYVSVCVCVCVCVCTRQWKSCCMMLLNKLHPLKVSYIGFYPYDAMRRVGLCDSDVSVCLVKICQKRPIYGDLCVFTKWPLAAILDFHRGEIWRHFCFWDIWFCLWTKFCVNVCICDRVMAVKVNFQNSRCRHLGFFRKWNLTSAEVAADWYVSPCQIWWRYLKGGQVMAIYMFSKWRPAAILDFRRSEIWRYFCFRDVSFSLSAKFLLLVCYVPNIAKRSIWDHCKKYIYWGPMDDRRPADRPTTDL